eukprot:8306719-Pyramimonas_sp.AAC.1
MCLSRASSKFAGPFSSHASRNASTLLRWLGGSASSVPPSRCAGAAWAPPGRTPAGGGAAPEVCTARSGRALPEPA